MNNKGSVLVVLLIVIIVLLAGTSGYFIYSDFSSQEEGGAISEEVATDENSDSEMGDEGDGGDSETPKAPVVEREVTRTQPVASGGPTAFEDFYFGYFDLEFEFLSVYDFVNLSPVSQTDLELSQRYSSDARDLLTPMSNKISSGRAQFPGQATCFTKLTESVNKYGEVLDGYDTYLDYQTAGLAYDDFDEEFLQQLSILFARAQNEEYTAAETAAENAKEAIPGMREELTNMQGHINMSAINDVSNVLEKYSDLLDEIIIALDDEDYESDTDLIALGVEWDDAFSDWGEQITDWYTINIDSVYADAEKLSAQADNICMNGL